MNQPDKKCNGAHCKCMNLGKQCPNNHYGDHVCSFVPTPPAEEEKVEVIMAECLECGQSSLATRNIVHTKDCNRVNTRLFEQPPQQKEPETWIKRFKDFYISQKGYERYFPNSAEEMWINFIGREREIARTEAETRGWNAAIEALEKQVEAMQSAIDPQKHITPYTQGKLDNFKVLRSLLESLKKKI